jgi:phage tail sheath gpL-like
MEQKISSEEGQNSPSNSKENLKEIKEKRNWKSWSPQEKILFYEIIASGGNYGSLQKLFKTMNDVRIILINFLKNNL